MVITSYAALSGKDYNIGGKVLIPNPSVVTIEMVSPPLLIPHFDNPNTTQGDVQIGMAINGTSIGAGVIPGLILSPGLKNVYDFKVMILQNQLPAMLMLTLNGGSLSVSSTGTSINGTKIPWLSKPLEKLATNVPINTSYLKST